MPLVRASSGLPTRRERATSQASSKGVWVAWLSLIVGVLLFLGWTQTITSRGVAAGTGLRAAHRKQVYSRPQPRRLRAALAGPGKSVSAKNDRADLLGSQGVNVSVVKKLTISEQIPLNPARLEAREAESIVPPLPLDFRWQTYLRYHPELRDAGITTESEAEEHYQRYGAAKGLLYRDVRVIMRYTACTGLVNQLYSHIAALSLAAYLGVEVVLPPAAMRDSFANYFSTFKEQNQVVWSAAALETLLDVDHLVAFWGDRGMKVHKTQALEPFPDLTEPDAAFVPYACAEAAAEDHVVRMSGIYLRHLEMSDLVDRARQAVVGRVERLMTSHPGNKPPTIVLDLPCTFFMLRLASNQRLAAEVAKSLRWSAEVQKLADRVVAGVASAGDAEYNSVHLRIEKDARDWALIMGGEAVVWANYIEAMRVAGFNAGKGLYIASGLLTYGDNAELDHLVLTMQQEGLCQKAHYKELYLPQKDIEGLNSEQKALLDLLVLAKGYSFVGFGSSTFSYYLREYRTLTGIPPARSILVDASVIGTDDLFADAGRIS